MATVTRALQSSNSDSYKVDVLKRLLPSFSKDVPAFATTWLALWTEATYKVDALRVLLRLAPLWQPCVDDCVDLCHCCDDTYTVDCVRLVVARWRQTTSSTSTIVWPRTVDALLSVCVQDTYKTDILRALKPVMVRVEDGAGENDLFAVVTPHFADPSYLCDALHILDQCRVVVLPISNIMDVKTETKLDAHPHPMPKSDKDEKNQPNQLEEVALAPPSGWMVLIHAGMC
jgi:hypothetical protein